MRFKVTSEIMLTLLFIGMLTLAFNPHVRAHPMIVSVLIDYGNGSISWHDRVSLPGGATVFDATLAVANVNYTVHNDSVVSVEAINGVWNSHPFTWEWWYWDFTGSAWVYSPVSCDKYVLTHGEIIAWCYGNTTIPQEPTTPPPRTIIVPDDFLTIQAAINAAKERDRVYVREGTYPEHLVVYKPISLIGENMNTTVIDGGGTGNVTTIIGSYVNLTGFTIRNGTNGILIRTSDYNIVSGNIVTDNQCGVHLFATCECDTARENTIRNNLIKNNSIGIHLEITKDNVIYHNNFINNTQQAHIQTSEYTSSWDNGYPSGGNYWSDYNGTDLYRGPDQNLTGSDGRGDTPYFINSNNTDHYPLMTPYESTPPTITIVSPENKTYTTDNVALTFTLDELTSWSGYSLDGLANVTSGNTTLSGLSDGVHFVIVYANDTFGNMGSSDTVYFTIDTVPPSIEILSPGGSTYTRSYVSLSFTVDEATSWMGYSLDGQANITIAGNTTLTGLSDGMHNLVVYANDTVGNTGASEISYFTIETQAESFPMWIVATIVIIAVVGAALLVYFTKVKKTTAKIK